MKELDLYSEPFARTGNIAAEGSRRLLGRPALGLLQTVVREALQNSIDAARNGKAPRILVRSRTLSEDQLRCARQMVFAELADGNLDTPLSDVLHDGSLQVFEIADFGTTGLGGPTRADVPSDGPESLDFVNFMRNVGAARDTQQGGGTYGYGKTSLYALSHCTTILVDSLTSFRGEPVRRFMGCRLGDAFEAEGSLGLRRYTGRHWWGRSDGDGGVEPLESEEAEEFAQAMGMPSRGPESSGTTVMILAPSLDDDSDTGLELVETILWNFWPRMCRSTPAEKKLSVSIEVGGQEYKVPEPEEFPPLDLFAAALEAARSNEDAKMIACQRPRKDLGRLAICKGLRAPRHPAAVRSGSKVPEQSSHIALMRPVELVVKYIPGEPFPDSRFEWAGVFICSAETEVEQAFADSEPPTHDDWIPDTLPKGYPKTFVNVALRRLVDEARTFANPLGAGGVGETSGPSLASTAALMGRLLDSSSGKGPGVRGRGRKGGAGKRKTLSVSRPRFSRLEMHEEQPTAVFEAELVNDRSVDGMRLVARPYPVIDGSAASLDDLPFEFDGRVTFLSVGSNSADGPLVEAGTSSERVVCHVALPSEGAVGLKLTLEPEET